jgi:Flp pilus assembly protein TadD
MQLGAWRLESGDYQAALEHFTAVVSRARHAPEAWEGVARALHGLGREDEAIAVQLR